MGRKHVKHDIGEVVAAEEVMQRLNLKDNDGLYPFSLLGGGSQRRERDEEKSFL